jgi:tetratricopeptide (TPR) repeat protein
MDEAWYNKGSCHIKLGEYNKAIECFDKVIEIKQNDHDVWFNKACTYSLLKNKKEMLIYLEKAIELNETSKDEAKIDEDFKEYWNDPDFVELTKGITKAE